LIFTRDAPGPAARPDRDAALLRVRAGVYARAAEWLALQPWERYLARVHAVAGTWSEPIFTLESAAVLGGLPIFGEPRHIHLLSGGRASWRQGDIVVHGRSDDVPIAFTDGIRTTTHIATTLDLCRVLPPAFALAQADAAMRALRALGRSVDLAETGRAQANRRGLRQLDWVQEHATPAAESVAESVSRAVIEWLGYEAPELQVEFFHEGARDRCDFYWRRLRLIGESDGYGKYGHEDPEVVKQRIIAEKVREDRLRRHEGGVARWDFADAMSGTRLDAKLRASGLVPNRPAQATLLATLRTNPRSLPPAVHDRTARGHARRNIEPGESRRA
jgi:hypothetical protein